jgi:SulP family sulfate permease
VLEALARWWRSVRPGPGELRDGSVAGLPRAAAAVPDGMATAALVGVNPIHGLYGSFAGPIVGGLMASTRLMVVTTTSAAALAAFSALEGVPAENRLGSLFLMTVMAGVIMVAAGFFGLGRLSGFVSHSVMIGFLTGVALSILLGQIPGLAGASVDPGRSVEKALEVVTHPGLIDPRSLAIGLAALGLLAWLPRTRLRRYAALVAMIAPSLLVALVGYFDGVLQVVDTGEIVRGLPVPSLPPLRTLSIPLLAGAFSVAAIVLVQGAGVAQSYPNPRREKGGQDADFVAQGAANIAAGVVQGIPVGGSVSQTALNVSVGAKSRWASVMSGVWMIAVLVALSGLAERVAIPTLAAILIVASVGAIRPTDIAGVWRSGRQSQIAMITTFATTLLLPVAWAVGIGVALSILLSLDREAQDVRIVRLLDGPGGSVVEGAVPAALASGEVMVLQVYGSLFYAGARTFENELPQPDGAERPVVIVRMRGRTAMGATAFTVLSAYASALEERGGRLYLSGVDPALLDRFRDHGWIAASGPVRVFGATERLGESTREAMDDAEMFLLGETTDDEQQPAPPSWFARLLGWLRRPGAGRGGDDV